MPRLSVYDLGMIIVRSTGCGLSVFVGVPINVYILSRLLHKDTKKSNYYRLIMFMCCLDIYHALFGELHFVTDALEVYGPEPVDIVLAINQEVLWNEYNLQSFLMLIVVIHWKTVLKKSPKLDKSIYGVSICLFVIIQVYDVVYEYLPDMGLVADGDPTDKVLEDIRYYSDYIYFAYYSFVLIYYLVSVRTVNTHGYSAVTMKAYKRMALVHFSQCAFVELQFIYHYVGDFIFQYFYYLARDDRKQEKYIDNLYDIYDDIDVLEGYALLPCIRALFISWALRGLLTAQKRQQEGTTTSQSRRRTLGANQRG